MKLQTEVYVKTFPHKLNHTGKILMLGSCFAGNIGEQMANAKFNVCINPFGVIYNPASVASCMDIMLKNQPVTENDLQQHNDLYYNFHFHSSFSCLDKHHAIYKMNKSKDTGLEFLKKAEYIIITFGSAIAYKHTEKNIIAANCHKLPNYKFEKITLTVEEIINITNMAIRNVRAVNNMVNFIFTVSPVRHLSDGAHENQLSKSRLLLAVHEICNTNKNCTYFPAYEIMMDELRDYRFYADDMLHPSALAVDFIWQKFANAAIDCKSLAIIEEIKKLHSAKMHRAFNPNNTEHKNFLKTYYEKTRQLQQKYPEIDLNDELEYFGACD